MKKQKQNPVYLTIEQVGAIIHTPDYKAIMRFGRDHELNIIKRPKRILFIEHEVYDALERETQPLGI